MDFAHVGAARRSVIRRFDRIGAWNQLTGAEADAIAVAMDSVWPAGPHDPVGCMRVIGHVQICRIIFAAYHKIALFDRDVYDVELFLHFKVPIAIRASPGAANQVEDDSTMPPANRHETCGDGFAPRPMNRTRKGGASERGAPGGKPRRGKPRPPRPTPRQE